MSSSSSLAISNARAKQVETVVPVVDQFAEFAGDDWPHARHGRFDGVPLARDSNSAARRRSAGTLAPLERGEFRELVGSQLGMLRQLLHGLAHDLQFSFGKRLKRNRGTDLKLFEFRFRLPKLRQTDLARAEGVVVRFHHQLAVNETGQFVLFDSDFEMIPFARVIVA